MFCFLVILHFKVNQPKVPERRGILWVQLDRLFIVWYGFDKVAFHGKDKANMKVRPGQGRVELDVLYKFKHRFIELFFLYQVPAVVEMDRKLLLGLLFIHLFAVFFKRFCKIFFCAVIIRVKLSGNLKILRRFLKPAEPSVKTSYVKHQVKIFRIKPVTLKEKPLGFTEIVLYIWVHAV